MNIALILAGGTGVRAELDIPKQYYRVNDKPVLVYTLEKFQKSESVDSIYVVCDDSWSEEVLSYAHRFGIKKLVGTVQGGNTGLKSLKNGIDSIEALDDDLILIHDGVRPFVDTSIIDENIRVAKKYGMAVTSISSVETLVYTKDNCKADKFIPRDGIMRVQTPQTFTYHVLVELLNNTDLDSCAEPSFFSLYMSRGYSVYCSIGNEKNIKLTYPEDIDYFRKLFS